MSAHGVGRRDMGASRDAAFTRRIQNAFARPHAPTNSPAVSAMSVPTAILSGGRPRYTCQQVHIYHRVPLTVECTFHIIRGFCEAFIPALGRCSIPIVLYH